MASVMADRSTRARCRRTMNASDATTGEACKKIFARAPSDDQSDERPRRAADKSRRHAGFDAAVKMVVRKHANEKIARDRKDRITDKHPEQRGQKTAHAILLGDGSQRQSSEISP